ncbi:transporter substrate-binding domain-containing protein [Aciduricibacillus chroicocephali]|uniref:Transporter substrate-binding domain-containing protein n=1 Tax=Aciduricibacillus chroicocephali TaxID=3054939 RepID=A0ABY9KU85_9BACI|nr:transporter substrate-binding domain-containing protein [Bacillaceae bacterium 44XB]
MKKGWGFLVIAASLILLLAACGGGNEESKSKGDKKKALKDTYTVGTDNSFVPFEFQKDGKLTGFDVDLMKAIAEEAGFNVNFKTTNFDGIIPGLQTKSFDMAIAGIGITEERKKAIDYSDPYYESGLGIGVKQDNKDIKDIDDLKGKKIATRLGSTSADYIKKHLDGATPKEYEQLDQAYLAVENGSVDAILYDWPNVAYYIKTKGESLKMVGDKYQAEKYGIAVAKGQEELVDAVNDALKKLKENGKYDEINEKYFGKKESK